MKAQFSIFRVLLFLFSCVSVAHAQLTPGVTTRVFVSGITDAEYRYYLPTSFNPAAPPPLVIYFDPGGSAEYGMSKLRNACESVGWTLVCLEKIRNGTVENDTLMIREIFNDVRARLPYPKERFYLAGLSGGAWRANSQARAYWGEVAGLLLFGCWIGDYDDYTVFPDRLAVSRVNGWDDLSAIYTEPEDDEYYHRSAVRTHAVHFDGGHDIGPTDAIVEAIQWLEADWQQYGAAYVPVDCEQTAALLWQTAEVAWTSGDYSTAFSNVVEIITRYPMSSPIRQAERRFYELFADSSIREQVDWTPSSDAEAWNTSWTFMQRALKLGSANWLTESLALYDMATYACPTNARALAEYAAVITGNPSLRRAQWPQALAMAEEAMRLNPTHWRGASVTFDLLYKLGHTLRGYATFEHVMDIMPNTSGHVGNLKSDYNKRSFAMEAQAAEVRSLPLQDDIEMAPRNLSIHLRYGWNTLYGTTLVQTQTVHSGLTAVSITGAESLLFLNTHPLTNQIVWVDAYLQPQRTENVFTNPLPPWATAAYFVNPDGYLCVTDGGQNWRTLPHTPIPPDTWIRVSVGMDFADQTWRIRLNDAEVASGLPFYSETHIFDGFLFLHNGDQPSYIDTVTISTATPLPDRDLDGMPDEWETAHQLDPDNPADARLDPDGDHYANVEEYRLGMNPRVADAPDPAGYMTARSQHLLWGSFSNVPSLFRHTQWQGDVLLASREATSLEVFASFNGLGYSWRMRGSAPLQIPCSTNLEYFYRSDSMYPLIQGPLNGIYRIFFDSTTGEFSTEFLGLNDADGDGMADEWEQLYFGHPTAATPTGNSGNDVYPHLEKYFAGSSPYVDTPYSPYASISVAGGFNGWDTTSRPLTLVADHLWRGQYYSSAEREFKFAANGTWDTNWGDNSQATAATPFRDTANLNGNNIKISLPGDSSVTFLFNDATGEYACINRAADADRDGIPDSWETTYFTNQAQCSALADPDDDGRCNLAEYLAGSNPLVKDALPISPYTQIGIAGSFNGWNTTAQPMRLIKNHRWELDMTFSNVQNAEFKLAANGAWAINWGSPKAAAWTLPIQTTAVLSRADNFAVAGTLNGRYRLTFNDAFQTLTFEPLPDLLLTDGRITSERIHLSWEGLHDRFYSVYLIPDLLNQSNTVHLGTLFSTPPSTDATIPIPTNHPGGTFQIRLN